jgi:phosphotransferase system enzyme I (PtsI)
MDYPSEDEQFEVYKSALEQMGGYPVTIRTLDLGGDKLFAETEYQDHLNPALGLRAIRLCLLEKDIFRTQVRALLRASPYGNLRILLPMISGVDELRTAKRFLNEVKEDLKKKKVKVTDDIKLGIMIEIPSAAISARQLAKEVDFFSIGTNDLVQYTLAADRTNEYVSYLYNLLDPAVLSLIQNTVSAAKEACIEVGVCGEAAGDPLYLLPFLGLGIDALSMNPVSIPRVKKFLRLVTAEKARELVNKISALSTVAEIEKMVRNEAAKYLKIFEQSKTVKP